MPQSSALELAALSEECAALFPVPGKKTNSDYFGAASMLFWQRHVLGEG